MLAFNSIGETPAATATSAGALSLGMPPRTGPLDESALTRIINAVKAMRSVADVVVVYPHWGTQYTHDAVPAQHEVAHRLLDAGADAVIASHPHWVQGMELHDGKLVMHSLGNFVFDMTFSEQVQQGVALKVSSGARVRWPRGCCRSTSAHNTHQRSSTPDRRRRNDPVRRVAVQQRAVRDDVRASN